MAQETKISHFPVYLRTLRVNTIQSFNIFTKVADNFVLYHSGGNNFTEEVLRTLIENNVEIVYVATSDTEAYNRYLAANLPELLTDPNLNMHQKAQVAFISINTIGNSLFDKPEAESLGLFKAAVSKTTDFILKENDAIHKMISMTSRDQRLTTHSVNVGIFATGLASLLFRDQSGHNMQKISNGFFLHDIGKCMIPKEIFSKKGTLTHGEWLSVKQHPVDGYKILNKYDAIDDESRVIVMQHHERFDGKGYPMGLRGDEIHLYSQICRIADIFDALTSDRPHKSKRSSSYNALVTMKDEMAKELNQEFFHKFIVMFSDTYKKEPKTSF